MPLAEDSASAISPQTWTSVDARVANDLGREDFRRVADARRTIWTHSFVGIAAGAAIGAIAFYAVVGSGRGAALRRKHLWLSTLAGTAVGGYAGATIGGARAFSAIEDGVLSDRKWHYVCHFCALTHVQAYSTPNPHSTATTSPLPQFSLLHDDQASRHACHDKACGSAMPPHSHAVCSWATYALIAAPEACRRVACQLTLVKAHRTREISVRRRPLRQ